VEEHEGVVADDIVAEIGQRTHDTTRSLLVRAPGDAGRIEQRDEVLRRALVILLRVVVIEDAEVGARFEPQVVGLARMNARGVVVLLRVRGPRQQRAVDVRGRRAPRDARPVVVLHQDEEHRVDGAGAGTGPRPRGRCGRGGGRTRKRPAGEPTADEPYIALRYPEGVVDVAGAVAVDVARLGVGELATLAVPH